jgi:hypothetical protein
VERERLYGPSLEASNTMFTLAGGLNDKPAARRYLAQIGASWHPSVWSKRKNFDSVRNWALGN